MLFVCFSSKNWFRGCFARSSRLRSFLRKGLREIFFLSCHSETFATVSRLSRDQQLLAKCCLAKTGIFSKSDRESRDCLATGSRLRASREKFVLQWLLSRLSRDCFAAPYPAKNVCFQFYKADVTVFQNIKTSLPKLSSNLSQPNSLFHQFPFQIKHFSAFSSSRYVD